MWEKNNTHIHAFHSPPPPPTKTGHCHTLSPENSSQFEKPSPALVLWGRRKASSVQPGSSTAGSGPSAFLVTPPPHPASAAGVREPAVESNPRLESWESSGKKSRLGLGAGTSWRDGEAPADRGEDTAQAPGERAPESFCAGWRVDWQQPGCLWG